MSARSAPTAAPRTDARPGRALAAAFLLALAAACTSYYEVPIEVPISAKLDVEKYNRILVAGFVTQSNERIDLDAETVRLLRNQLATRSRLQVLDADSIPVSGASVEFDFLGDVPGAGIDPALVTTGDDGSAEAIVRLGTVSGEQLIIARVAGTASPDLSARFRLIAQGSGGDNGGDGRGNGHGKGGSGGDDDD